MPSFADHGAHIAAAQEDLQPLLGHLRILLSRTLPDLEEIILYDMPGFASGKSIVVSYAGFSKQCGLYVDKAAISAHAGALAAADLKSSRTCVTFTPKKPIPDDVVTSLALASRKALGL